MKHNQSVSFANWFMVFKISNVVLPDDGHIVTGTVLEERNARRICSIYYGPTQGSKIIHSPVDCIMTLAEVDTEGGYAGLSGKYDKEKLQVIQDGWKYTIQEIADSNR